MRYTAAPLGEILRELAASAEFEQFSLLKRLSTASAVSWRDDLSDAVRCCSVELGLTAEDERLLAAFTNGWGTADVQGEIHRFEQYAVLFEEQCSAARDVVKRRGQVYVTWGVCGGSALALLLL